MANEEAMIEPMKAWARKTTGFTIVELLIVIVVIAILAAITIIAYNGIQTRAENTKTTNAVEAYVKALSMYATDNGLYPQYNYPCLGGVSPCSNMTDGVAACPGYGAASGPAAFDTAVATEVTRLPAVSTQQMTCDGKTYRGAFYSYTNGGKDSAIVLYLKGFVSCPTIGGTTLAGSYQNTNTTSCYITLPTLS